LYFPDGASSIGVAVSDNPAGPYVDPLGHSLVDHSTPNANVQWLFDPGVFIDDDEQAYLCFGGGAPGNARIIKLNKDMISTSGAAITVDAPNFFEAMYLHKRGDTYYVTYSTNPAGGMTIDYMTSKSPTSGYVHRGTVLANPWQNNGNNNHASIIDYKDQWYIFYHNRAVANKRGASIYQRSINVDLLYYNDDGTIKEVNADSKGVPKLGNVDPFQRIEAEIIDNESGIETETASEGTLNLTMNNGSWVKISNVDFNVVAEEFSASVAATGSTSIDIVLDDIDSQPVGTLTVASTGGLQDWQTQSTAIEPVTGLHDLFVRANGRVNLDWYQFTISCDTPDVDADGYESRACGGDDCDDQSKDIHPGAAETCGDGVDQDCDGKDQECSCDTADADGDGHASIDCGGDDCDDQSKDIHPGAAETCGDGVDQDCDGQDNACGFCGSCGCRAGSDSSSHLDWLCLALALLLGWARLR
jgi:hypothetical protein